MPRPVQLVPRSEIPPSERDRYDLVVQRQRMHQGVADGEKLALGPYHAALASAPALGALISELGRTVRERGDVPGSYSHADREFADQVLAADARWDGFTIMHTLDGVSAGVRIEAMAAIRAGHEEDLTADERLLATYIRQVVSGTVQDETWASMEARLGSRGLIEYTMFITFLNLVMRLFQAFGAPDTDPAHVDELVRAIRSGEVTPPSFRERIN